MLGTLVFSFSTPSYQINIPLLSLFSTHVTIVKCVLVIELDREQLCPELILESKSRKRGDTESNLERRRHLFELDWKGLGLPLSRGRLGEERVPREFAILLELPLPLLSCEG